MKKLFLVVVGAGLFLASCVSNPEGEKAAVQETQEVAVAKGDSFQLNPQESVLQWTGRKVSATHHGKVNFKSGNLVFNNGLLSGGSFIVDMPSITNEDQEGEWKEKLVGHLSSPDFFNTTEHPEAKFEITEVKKTDNPNQLVVSGNLTIKGITKNITFNADVKEISDTKAVFSTDFNIAREDWELTYPGKPDDLIAKEINFKVDLVANKI
ncbi:MAG TPA: YceI family protein [Niabella sp.]|jgi:polyisoprenoid-binding protein YceI|nr:YceI family protein [Chitinophagaceae bacterium]HRO86128.1 YceI family protein [Niabella sp.]HUN03997.1 YceI family protein [Niabella sp.]